MQAPLFIVNDENVQNSYGFFVLNDGIDLKTRFENNPICLNGHSTANKDVLGQWKDIELKEGKLYMRPDFDTEDADGKEVVRKVLAGKIKAASLGIMFDPKDMIEIDGRVVLLKCVLFEVSIVSVPSNGGAIALFDMEGEQFTDKQINQIKLKIQGKAPTNPKPMKLIAKHLNLDENTNENAVLAAIRGIQANYDSEKQKAEKLTNEIQTLKASNKKLVEAEGQRQKTALNAELKLAIKDGRINAESKQEIQALGFEPAMKLLKALPKRKKIADQIEEPETSQFAKLTWAELDKQGLLSTLKAEDETLFAEKYQAHFGKEYKK